MELKSEVWQKVKDIVDELLVDDIEEVHISVTDRYVDTTDIDINIEVKKPSKS